MRSKKCKIHLFAAFFFIVLLFSNLGCAWSPSKYFSKKVNLGGAITHEPTSYTPVETGTFRFSSEDIANQRDFRGGKTTLLWGLFTYTDY